jgi:diaminopimelate decarboxylase
MIIATKAQLNRIIGQYGTPTFIYSEDALRKNITRIQDAARRQGLENRISLYVAYFANSNPHLFKIVSQCGAGILIQTAEEYFQLKKFHLEKNSIVSPSFLSDTEIDFWAKRHINLNIASIEEVEYWISRYPTEPLGIRIDCTRDERQRTAIKQSQLPQLKAMLSKARIPLHSFHIYSGTGSSLEKIKQNVDLVLDIYNQSFPESKILNLGGGFGFDYGAITAEQKHFNWDGYFYYLAQQIREKNIPAHVQFIIEPGRDVFADIGSFLVSVHRIIRTPRAKQIATDGSYVFMPSATIRARQHHTRFFNASLKERIDLNDQGFLSGCTTLSGDYVFPGAISAPTSLRKGDYILIDDVGAYCATQHLEFLNKRPCPEILIQNDGALALLTHRGAHTDRIRYSLLKPRSI